MLVFAFLGGLLSKCSPNQSAEWGGSFFNVIGFKSKEQIQREQLDKLLHKYLQDQVEYMDNSKEDVESLSKMVENASDHDQNVDLLRLKYLMKQFEDLNVLMIEDGKELVTYNQNQRKKNKRNAQIAGEASLQSKGDQMSLLEKQKDTLERQEGLINELQQLMNNPGIQSNPSLANKLNSISNKSLSHLGQLKQEQDQIRKVNNRSIKNSYMKEKMEDLRNKNQDSMRDSRMRIEDQTRQINDRIHDQMDRLKDMR